ncbi:MAG: CotH kinase family protein [Oscillospiraceae bacterium]|nr:CotH kinase family protein [Oscillospiraceae bacterium]
MRTTNKRIRIFVVFLAALGLLFALDALDVGMAISLSGGEIRFSGKTFFLDRDEIITLGTRAFYSEGDIYYTLDGSEPTIDSVKYVDGIALRCGDDVKVYTIKAKIISDKKESDTYVQSYFVSRDIHNRFHNLVFAISTDPDNLYGYKNGILVEGKVRDDWIKKNPGKEITNRTPANYTVRGKESEREVFVEVFRADGAKIMSQRMNMRVSGGTYTRNKEQKSFRLFARTTEGKGVVRYPFFEGRISVAKKVVIADYLKLWLRTGSQDFRKTFLKDVIAGQLALNAGVIEASHARPAAVYLGGEYYGYANLQELIEENFLYANYGGIKANYVVADSMEAHLRVNYGDESYNQKLQESFALFSMDLRDEQVFQAVRDTYDLDSFLFYYAFLVYINNPDSVNNNYVTWTYNAEGQQIMDLNVKKYLDGKWRPIIKDYDVALGPLPYSLLRSMLGGDTGSGLAPSIVLSALLTREDMKNQFINTLLDQRNYILCPEAIISVVDKKYEEAKHEIYYYINSAANDRDAFNEASFEEEIDKMRLFARERPATILKELREEFGLADEYTLTIQKGNAYVQLNSISIDLSDMREDFSGSYFSEVPVTLTYMGSNGMAFDKWIVNGVAYDAKSLTITKEHIVNNRVYIEVLCK